MPDEAPVTMARLPVSSMPVTTSAAVERKPNGVLIRAMATSIRRRVTGSQVPSRFTLTLARIFHPAPAGAARDRRDPRAQQRGREPPLTCTFGGRDAGI